MKNNNIFIRQKASNSVLSLLNSILSGRKYPDILIGELFRKEDFSQTEKAFIAELVYGILRHLGRLDYRIEHTSRANIKDLDPEILNSIRICTYQAIFTDTSIAGILNNATALSSHNSKLSGFAKRTVESIVKNKDTSIFPDREKHPIEYIAAYYSHPRWIVEKWREEFGSIKEVEALCCANTREPPLTIRLNPLKSHIESLQEALAREGYSSFRTQLSPFGLFVDRKEDIFKTPAFKDGLFEMQDEGSQLVTLLTGAKPGELIIDACAGNGGKSLFLSGLMKNRGRIIASDLSIHKLTNIRRRARKAGAYNITTSSPDRIIQYDNMADCILIDAPCSGMGVFRRNPDSKWRLRQNDIYELAMKQKDILHKYSSLAKSGGRIVYATCTISREENEDIVHGFLNENKDYFLQGDFFRSLPHLSNTDGFFGAVMIKK